MKMQIAFSAETEWKGNKEEMALRTVRELGDAVLEKTCKPVKEMTPRIQGIIQDMYETMYHYNGVGLAAPQVGILKRICVIDVGDGNQYTLINPEIIECSGSQTGNEGCLSVPGKAGVVTRPNEVTVRALNEKWSPIPFPVPSFWPGPSAMRLIIWMAECTYPWWKAS